MSAGKGSSPRSCFSQEYRENFDRIFAPAKRAKQQPSLERQSFCRFCGAPDFTPARKYYKCGSTAHGQMERCQIYQAALSEYHKNFFWKPKSCTWPLSDGVLKVLKYHLEIIGISPSAWGFDHLKTCRPSTQCSPRTVPPHP
jgi:hypothetical protein